MKKDLENIKSVLPIGPPEGSYMEGNIYAK